jgi:hypothetical protein
LFVCLWTFFITFAWKVKAINYGRLHLWNLIGLLAVYWLASLALLNNLTGITLAYVIALFVGWGVLVIVGTLV